MTKTPTSSANSKQSYDCLKCPGYCCSYPVIVLTKRDVTRLAKNLDLDFETTEKRFTRKDHGYKRVMRRKPDAHYARICHFFDLEERRCTIYNARPAICRQFPGTKNCGYYDFLKFERKGQEDEEYISTTWHDQD